MFNLKRKSEQQIITEIHNEFDTAEDRLLEQADKLLAELNIPTETSIEAKAEKLKILGFVNSEVVLQAKSLTEQRDKQQKVLVSTKEQAERIRYYKQSYPFQKFLTEQELDRICEKYNLIYAPVSNYIKDVPEKNIKEIELATSLNINDAPPLKMVIKTISSYYSVNKKDVSEIVLSEEEAIRYSKITYDAAKWDFVNRLDCIRCGLNELSSNYRIMSHVCEEENKSGLFIAAPISHFNTKGLTKKGKFAFLNIKVTEVKDPIVFRYVRGGVQVLSKWGLEGEDESLVNEKLN